MQLAIFDHLAILKLHYFELNTVDIDMPPQNLPLTALFDYRERDLPQFSPDGAHYTFVAPDGDAPPTLWISKSPGAPAQLLLPSFDHPLTNYSWAYTNTHILFLRDDHGNENWQLHVCDITTGTVSNIMPRPSMRVLSYSVCPEHPDTVVIVMNARDRALYDVYTYSLETQRLSIMARNDGTVKNWIIDRTLKIRGKVVFDASGKFYLYARRTVRSKWYLAHTWHSDERLISGALSFSPDGNTLYLTSADQTNTCALLALNTTTREKTVIAHDLDFDTYLGAHLEDIIPPIPPYQSMLFAPDGTLVGMSYYRNRLIWHFFNPIPDDMQPLKSILSHPTHQYWITQESDDHIVLGRCSETEPTSYWHYDRATGELSPLCPPSLAPTQHQLVRKRPVTFQSRDGLTIHGYLSLPHGVEKAPLVVKIHGGPWTRDITNFEPDVQFLSQLGYGCLQVNYRGSSGYGKTFSNAGDGQWGTRMIDDIVDGALWACEQGYTDKERMAVMGRSYGGYAALQAAASYPDLFTCIISEVPPTHLPRMLETQPQHWLPFSYDFRRRIGHPSRDRSSLAKISPALNPEKLTLPLLLAHGKHDFRVNFEQAERLLHALNGVTPRPTVLSFENEGHQSRRIENIVAYHEAVKNFLLKYLPPSTS